MPGEQILAVKGANKSFRRPNGEPLVVLESVDLTLKEGELVGLLGRSGSGKSTLLRLIAGLSNPNGGSVDIWASRWPDRRRASPWCSKASRSFPG